MLTDFPRYNLEIERFKKGKLYSKIYRNAIEFIQLNGRKNKPVSSKTLEEYFGIGGKSLRTIVSFARCEDGFPIGSNNDGYFWAKNIDEINDTINHMEERAFKIQKAANSLKEAFATQNQLSCL